jgi:hypothetical protein
VIDGKVVDGLLAGRVANERLADWLPLDEVGARSRLGRRDDLDRVSRAFAIAGGGS